MTRDRYFIAAYGPDDDAFRQALAFAIQSAKTDPRIKRVVLFAHTKGNMGFIERVFGADKVKGLFNGATVNGVPFKTETIGTYPSYGNPEDFVICMSANMKLMNEAEQKGQALAILGIPWGNENDDGGIGEWTSVWNPVDITTGKPVLSIVLEPKGIVRAALKSLTGLINRQDHLTSHRDDEHLKNFLRTLKHYGEELDGALIEGYLQRELGWTVRGSALARTVIENLNTGKKFKGGSLDNAEFYYKRWQELAQEDEKSQ